MTPPAPSPPLVERFRADTARAAGEEIARLGLAVSGGPDSVAMLLLSAAAFPGRVSAATVDHGLRPENAYEAAWVGTLCHGLGVPHIILGPVKQMRESGGVQAQARALRYHLLAGWARDEGCGHVATAHHADDQADTLMLRLARGSGLPGLAGIRRRRPIEEGDAIMLIRPCLDWRREELAAVVATAGIAAVDDPSNRAPRFDRSRIRAWLAAPDAPPAVRIGAAANHLADCEAALAWAADAAWNERATEGEALVLNVEGLPREIRRRLVKRAIDALRETPAAPWREDGVNRLLATLEGGGRATLAGVVATGGAPWRLRRAPPRRL